MWRCSGRMAGGRGDDAGPATQGEPSGLQAFASGRGLASGDPEVPVGPNLRASPGGVHRVLHQGKSGFRRSLARSCGCATLRSFCHAAVLLFAMPGAPASSQEEARLSAALVALRSLRAKHRNGEKNGHQVARLVL